MQEQKDITLKSMPIKVRATEQKLQLYFILRDYAAVTSQIENSLMAFSGRALCDKDGNVILNSSDIIAKWAKKSGTSLEKMRAALRGFYDDFTEASLARGFVAFLTQANTVANNTHANCLRKAGIMPFSYKGQIYDPLDAQGGYKYAVIGSIHNRLRSWCECDAATTKEWNQVKEDMDKARESVTKNYSEAVLNALDKWLEDVKPLNFNLGRTAKKFASFFEHTLHASLKAGKPIAYGTWKTNNGKDVEYACPEEVVTLLFKKYRLLWDTDASILASKDFFSYVESYDRFQRKRPFASYTPIDFVKSPVNLLLGNNYVAIQRKTGIVADSEKKTITITIKFPKVLKGENSKEWLSIPCTYNRAFKGKRGYFENLAITPVTNKEGNETGTYLFDYAINGKRSRRALVKEPYFRMVVRNPQMDLNNPKVTDFDIYLVFPMNVEVQSCHDFEKKELINLRAALSTAYPENKDFGKQKTIAKDTKIEVNAPLLVMGVDLGLRNPLAYSIYRYSKKDAPILVKSGVITTENSSVINSYRYFRGACFNLKKFIASTRYYRQGYRNTVDGSWLRFLNDYLSKQINGYVPYTIEQYIEWLKKHEKTPLIEFKLKENNWIVRTITYQLRQILLKLTAERVENNQFSTHFEWISTQEMFIKAMRSFQMVGIDSKTIKPSGLPYRNMKDRIDNLKKDYMKKLAFVLSELAKENGVAIVVTEQLDGLRGNVYNDKDRNQLFNAWPVGQIKHYFTNALANYGILHAEADERHSSQTVSETGVWGYRDEEDLNLLWWVDKDGKMYHTHADENAAKNITLRYLSRHTRQNSLRMAKIAETLYIPASAFSTAEGGGKRERGFLSRYFLTSRPVFELREGQLVQSQKTFKEVSKKVKGKTLEITPWFFTDNTFKKLMDRDRRDLLEKQIKDMPKPKL